MSEQRQDTYVPKRAISVLAYGTTSDELEMDALDKARAFFGADAVLQLDRNYGAVASGNRPGYWIASVRICEV